MYKIVFIVVCTLQLVFLGCGSKIASGGVENGNPVLSGYVSDDEGTAVQNTIIKLIPFNNNPQFTDTVAATALSDDKGRYSFDRVDEGLYNIFGETPDGSLSFIDSITVDKDSSTQSNYVVKSPGYFKGVVKLQPYRQGMVLIVLLGTNIYTMTTDTIGNYSSPKLPEGTYRAVIISTLPEFADTQITIDIVSGATTLVDTVALVYSSVSVDSGLLQRFRDCNTNLPGTYAGTVTASWEPSWNIAFVIDTDGQYSAYTTTTTDIPALSYGTDADDSRKKIVLTQIQPNGGITGSIRIVFDAHTAVQDEIRELRFNARCDSLTFEVWHADFGPLQISLRRIDPDSLPARPVATPVISVDGSDDTTQVLGCFYIDSVRITISVDGSYPVIYQVVDGVGSVIPPENNWRDDLPYQTYTEPFTIDRKGTNQVILARVRDGESISGVAKVRIIIDSGVGHE